MYALGKLSSSSEALQLNLLLHYGHRMHLSWTLRLSTISAILASLCILSSATPTSFTITKDGANHEVSAKAVPGPLRNLPALPQTQSISNRGLSYGSWGNGWSSRSNTYSALLPVLPAAAKLSLFYTKLHLLSSSFPPTLSATAPAILDGIAGQMVRFQCGGLELSFFSSTLIPWSFVATVAARLRQSTANGFTGLHGTVFEHKAAGLVVFVTLVAAGVPVPVPGLLPR